MQGRGIARRMFARRTVRQAIGDLGCGEGSGTSVTRIVHRRLRSRFIHQEAHVLRTLSTASCRYDDRFIRHGFSYHGSRAKITSVTRRFSLHSVMG